MPEHFHLLISKPEVGDPSVVLQVLKQRVARRGLKIIALGMSSPTLSQKMGKDGAAAFPVQFPHYYHSAISLSKVHRYHLNFFYAD